MKKASRRRPPIVTACRKIGEESTVPGSSTTWRRSLATVAAVTPVGFRPAFDRAASYPKSGQSAEAGSPGAGGAGALVAGALVAGGEVEAGVDAGAGPPPESVAAWTATAATTTAAASAATRRRTLVA
jgi:hypothetical protein